MKFEFHSGDGKPPTKNATDVIPEVFTAKRIVEGHMDNYTISSLHFGQERLTTSKLPDVLEMFEIVGLRIVDFRGNGVVSYVLENDGFIRCQRMTKSAKIQEIMKHFVPQFLAEWGKQ